MSKVLLYGECILLGLIPLAVIAQRFQLLPFKVAFGSFALLVVLAAILSLLALLVLGLSFGPVNSSHRSFAGYAFILGLVPLVAIVAVVGKGMKVPRIHDISTDTQNNMDFENAHGLRSTSHNSIALPSSGVVDQQLSYYTKIAPLIVTESQDLAYKNAITHAEHIGWEITYRNDEAFQFEATETTAIFRFVDDIVVRVSDHGGASKIDIRSVSRVGKSDLGANAARIHRFQQTYRVN